MLLTPINKNPRLNPKTRLKEENAPDIKIKNPSKYNSGNFIKSNTESLGPGLRSKAMLKSLQVSVKLRINQAAEVRAPAQKSSLSILVLLVYPADQPNNPNGFPATGQ